MDKEQDRQRLTERLQAVKRRNETTLLNKANVVGVGVGFRHRGGQKQKEIVLVVMVERKLPLDKLAPEDVIPGEIEGVPVDVQQVGQLSAF